MSRRGWSVGRVSEIAGFARAASRGRDERLLLHVLVDALCPRELALAVRDALVPERPGARVEVRRLAGARPGDELPDAAVALVAPGSDVSAVRAYARAGVPGGRGRGGGARGAGARPRGGTGRARRCRGRLQRGRPARQARGMARLGVREGPRARRPTSPSAAGAVVDSLVSRCALENAVVGVVRLVPGSDLPVMTANQLRLAPRRRGRVRPAARAGPGLRARGRRRRGPRVARARPGAHAARGPRGGGRFCARGSPAPARWPRAPPCACASRRPDLLARAAERPRGARLCARPSRRGRPPPERGTSRSGRSAHEGGAGEPLSSDRAAARARGAPGALPRPRVGGLRASGRPLPSVHGLRRRLRGRPAQPRRRDSLQPGERPGGHELRALLPAVDGPVGPHAGARRAAACRSRAPPRSPPSTRSASRSPTSSSPPTSWRRSTSRASRSPPRSATRTTPSSSRAVRRPGTASRSRPSLTRCCSATGEESIVEVCDSEIARASRAEGAAAPRARAGDLRAVALRGARGRDLHALGLRDSARRGGRPPPSCSSAACPTLPPRPPWPRRSCPTRASCRTAWRWRCCAAAPAAAASARRG